MSIFIAGGYMVDKSKGNPGLDNARLLAYDDVEKAYLAEQEPGLPTTSARDNKPVDPDEAIARALAKNSAGSFERFMGMTRSLDGRGKMI